MCSCSIPALEAEQEAEVSQESCSPQRQMRSLIFHLLYAMDSYDYDSSLASVIDCLNRGFETTIDPQGEIALQAQAIIENRDKLDEEIIPMLANWRLDRIGLCTRLILRMAVWELQQGTIGPKIVINEAIELAKCFSERDAYKFVNGVLDEYLKRLEAQRAKS